MSGPRYSRETFATPESTFPTDDQPNGKAPHGEADNLDETRPRSYGVPSGGPAGGFEPHPFGSAPGSAPPPSPVLPPTDGVPPMHQNDGFSEPTLTTGSFQEPKSEPGSLGSLDPSDVTGYTAPVPGPDDAPTAFTPNPVSHLGAPDPLGGYGPRPGLGDQPPNFGPGGPGSYGEPTMGFGGVAGAPPGGLPPGSPPLRPPMAPPSGLGPPPSAGPRPRPQQRARGPRRAKLQLRHINPWTVLKFSCVLSVALFFVWLITIGLLYGILQAAGVIDSINHAVTTINGNGSSQPVTPGLVFGGAAILGVINVILFIALSTVGSVVYNLCADLVGGVEVTLSERD